MIVTQNRVCDGDREALGQLLFEPARAVGAADLTVDNGDTVLADDKRAVGQTAVALNMLGQLLDLERRQVRLSGGSGTTERHGDERQAGVRDVLTARHGCLSPE